jgi:two-component system chemotaxis response regulator CheV
MGGAMMVTEYSKRTLGFLVHEVDRIVRVDWDRVRAPETVVTGEGSTSPPSPNSTTASWCRSSTSKASSPVPSARRWSATSRRSAATRRPNVFFVDDSAVARKKITEVLDKLGVRHKHATNGAEAWARLLGMARPHDADRPA